MSETVTIGSLLREIIDCEFDYEAGRGFSRSRTKSRRQRQQVVLTHVAPLPLTPPAANSTQPNGRVDLGIFAC